MDCTRRAAGNTDDCAQRSVGGVDIQGVGFHGDALIGLSDTQDDRPADLFRHGQAQVLEHDGFKTWGIDSHTVEAGRERREIVEAFVIDPRDLFAVGAEVFDCDAGGWDRSATFVADTNGEFGLLSQGATGT